MIGRAYRSEWLPWLIGAAFLASILTGAVLASWLGLALILFGVALWVVLLLGGPAK